ncbi:Bug family tripartite tricarboxylate transporter substrate binding protein [Lampropedia aestuarii]|uniref:Bug family tripartite tricarboxylate transporter substrate binding protein n=1 Tax=Lampropedia aestuarii TaxID=2562762 RepID=UPI0024691E3E|nr:tripartite tricarboxylate transporter substrate binding protein [Lampropedia aestuarii]MDH5858716.1 tripartite tricarboxylate transporter substrate binding protein [Lampropedia aestuarii]
MTLSSTRRHMVVWSALALCGLCASAVHAADAYPNKPIRLVVPYPPGGPTDIVARVIAQKMQEEMGQTWVVDNRPGAGANLGAENVARSPADGYTLLVATTAHAINPSLFSNLSYSLQEDFLPVSQLTSGALVIVANPSLPVEDVKGLIALAKSKEGGLNFATSGNGQSTHLAAEMFSAMAGVKMNHIPYKGSAPALSDVVAGHADLMFDTLLSATPFIKSGKLKALAVTSAERSASAPDIPTIAEAGLPGYEAIAWNGILAPAGTPAEVIEALNAGLKKVLESADVKDRFASQGFAATWNSPADYKQFLNNEISTWAQVVKDSGARVE